METFEKYNQNLLFKFNLMSSKNPQGQPRSVWEPLQSMNHQAVSIDQQAPQQRSQSIYQEETPYQSNPVRYPELEMNIRGPQQANAEPLLVGGNLEDNEQYQSLEKTYRSFYHFYIVNLALFVVTILIAVVQVIAVIAFSSSSDELMCSHIYADGHDQVKCVESDDDFFTDDDSKRFFVSLFVMFIIVIKGILAGIYFAGKYVYDLKTVQGYKIMLVVYAVLFILNLFSWSLISMIIFAYLGFCAYKLKEVLENIEEIKNKRRLLQQQA